MESSNKGIPMKTIIPDSSANSLNLSENEFESMLSKINLFSIPSSIASLNASKTLLVFTGCSNDIRVKNMSCRVKSRGIIFFMIYPAKTWPTSKSTALAPIKAVTASAAFSIFS
jgi:hypothetical protein